MRNLPFIIFLLFYFPSYLILVMSKWSVACRYGRFTDEREIRALVTLLMTGMRGLVFIMAYSVFVSPLANPREIGS